VVYQLQQKLHSECACAVPFVAECGLIHVCVLICVSTRKISRAAAAWSVYVRFASARLSFQSSHGLSARRQMRRFATHTTHRSDEDEPLLQMQMRSKLFSLIIKAVKGARNYSLLLVRWPLAHWVIGFEMAQERKCEMLPTPGDDTSLLNGLTGKADLWPQLVVIFAKGFERSRFYSSLYRIIVTCGIINKLRGSNNRFRDRNLTSWKQKCSFVHMWVIWNSGMGIFAIVYWMKHFLTQTKLTLDFEVKYMFWM